VRPNFSYQNRCSDQRNKQPLSGNVHNACIVAMTLLYPAKLITWVELHLHLDLRRSLITIIHYRRMSGIFLISEAVSLTTRHLCFRFQENDFRSLQSRDSLNIRAAENFFARLEEAWPTRKYEEFCQSRQLLSRPRYSYFRLSPLENFIKKLDASIGGEKRRLQMASNRDIIVRDAVP